MATLRLGPSGKSGTDGAPVATRSPYGLLPVSMSWFGACHQVLAHSILCQPFATSLGGSYKIRFFGPIAEDLRPKCRLCSLFGCTDFTDHRCTAVASKMLLQWRRPWNPVIFNRTDVGVIWVLCSLATAGKLDDIHSDIYYITKTSWVPQYASVIQQGLGHWGCTEKPWKEHGGTDWITTPTLTKVRRWTWGIRNA